MRSALLIIAGTVAASAAAAEVTRAETCRRGDDRRIIEVVSPGTVGAACDVVYSRDDGATVSVPYNANMDRDYCRARAAELAANLAAQGFECAKKDDAAIEAAIEAALDGGATTPTAVEPALAEGSSLSLNAQLDRLIAETDAAAPAAEPLKQPDAAPAPAIAAAPAPEAPTPAAADPVQLARDVRTIEYRAPEPPKTTGARRLVGAQPAIDDIIDVSTDPAKEAKAAADAAGIPPRADEEIIRGVIAANAAAWNEGNLDAYMNGYANAADTMLVDNAVVTAGWAPLKKTFERDIAAAGAMGRLTFGGLDVRMTSEDVATVVGKYSIARANGGRGGVVTLVMKRIDGVWRIVQETRVANP